MTTMTECNPHRCPDSEQSRPRTSGRAVASLLIGVLSFGLWVLILMPTPLLGAVAAIVGVYALTTIHRSQGRLQGRVIASLGVGTGVLNLILGLLFLLSGGSASGFA